MWLECYVRLKQSSSRNRSSSVEEGISQAQAPGYLQVRDQRTVGCERRVVRGRAGRDLRAAGAERFGQIDADPDPFDAAHSRSWRGAFDGAQAPGRRERCALEDRARERRRRVLQETVGAREPALLGLSYGLQPKRAGKRAFEILERLGIESRRFSDPLEEMSGGMQQKVSIARALMINPPMLLLDEPTTGLDPKSRRDVQRFLEELRQEEG